MFKHTLLSAVALIALSANGFAADEKMTGTVKPAVQQAVTEKAPAAAIKTETKAAIGTEASKVAPGTVPTSSEEVKSEVKTEIKSEVKEEGKKAVEEKVSSEVKTDAAKPVDTKIKTQ